MDKKEDSPKVAIGMLLGFAIVAASSLLEAAIAGFSLKSLAITSAAAGFLVALYTWCYMRQLKKYSYRRYSIIFGANLGSTLALLIIMMWEIYKVDPKLLWVPYLPMAAFFANFITAFISIIARNPGRSNSRADNKSQT